MLPFPPLGTANRADCSFASIIAASRERRALVVCRRARAFGCQVEASQPKTGGQHDRSLLHSLHVTTPICRPHTCSGAAKPAYSTPRTAFCRTTPYSVPLSHELTRARQRAAKAIIAGLNPSRHFPSSLHDHQDPFVTPNFQVMIHLAVCRRHPGYQGIAGRYQHARSERPPESDT